MPQNKFNAIRFAEASTVADKVFTKHRNLMEKLSMDANELKQREDALVEEVVKRLPQFARACDQNVDAVILHQDAFAADYDEDEYRLLGMAIKYAGLRGKDVQVIGENRGTLSDAKSTG